MQAATSRLRAAALAGDASLLEEAVAYAEALGLEEEAARGKAKLQQLTSGGGQGQGGQGARPS